jgi:predicted ArsR family transcriptional regulator
MQRFDALGDQAVRETLTFVRSQPRPVTAAEVAEAVGAPRSVARWRLERLVAAGLLVADFERRSSRRGPGAGRPSKTYAAAPETEALEFPPRRLELLLSMLVDALPTRARPARLHEIGADFGKELARAAGLKKAATLATGLERVCRGLRRLGFHAAVESVSATEAVIVSATCPLRPLVVEKPAARDLDAGMWVGLLGAAVKDQRLQGLVCETEECLQHGSPCRIRLRWAQPAAELS